MTSDWPKLAGIQEASEILGVSRARVDQLLHSDPKFPQPIGQVRAGRIWLASELSFYAMKRDKTPGRRKGKRVKPS